MLHPVTLLEAAKGKGLTFVSDQPDLLDGRCRSSVSRCSGGGYSGNQQLRYIRQLRFNLPYGRMKYGVVRVVAVPLVYNVTLVGLFASSVWWSIFALC